MTEKCTEIRPRRGTHTTKRLPLEGAVDEVIGCLHAARRTSPSVKPECFVLQQKSGTFLLTRDTLRYTMPPTQTNCPSPQHTPEPILTEPNCRCRKLRAHADNS